MSHEIEQTEVDGKIVSLAAYRGKPAWHGLGTVFDQDAKITTADMLSLANLAGWNVRKVPAVQTGRGEGISPHFEVVRDNPFDQGLDTLGWVDDRYRVHQNEELFNFGDTLLDGGGAWETAGSLFGGRRVFGSLKVDQSVVTLDPNGRNDKIDMYLVVCTSHDGTLPLTFLVSPIRVECNNLLTAALRSAPASIKVRHTATASERINAARSALGISFAYTQEWATWAGSLLSVDMSDQQFVNIVKAYLPEPAEGSKAAATRREARLSTIMGVYRGETNRNVYGTAWGGLNAMTETLDWYRKPRKGNAESSLAAAAGFDAVANAERQRIMDIFSGKFLTKNVQPVAFAVA